MNLQFTVRIWLRFYSRLKFAFRIRPFNVLMGSALIVFGAWDLKTFM